MNTLTATAGQIPISNAHKTTASKVRGSVQAAAKSRRQRIRKRHRGYVQQAAQEQAGVTSRHTGLSRHALNIPRIGKKKKSIGKRAFKTARAMTASVPISIFALPLYFIIIFFSIISILGFGAEKFGQDFVWGLFDSIIYGELVFGAGYVATMVLGIFSMFLAGLIYILHGVLWFKGKEGAWFGLFIILYLAPVPFISMFPWLGIWMLIVINEQRKA